MVMTYVAVYWLRILCFIAMALCNVKNGTSFSYAIEMAGSKNAKFVSLVINVFDRSTLFIVGFTVIFISRWWVFVATLYLLASVASWITIYLYIPESPNWLMMNDRTEEAIEALN